MLEADILALDDAGLGRLGERIEKLRARYAAVSHPGAAEVLKWLNFSYRVSSEDVATQ